MNEISLTCSDEKLNSLALREVAMEPGKHGIGVNVFVQVGKQVLVEFNLTMDPDDCVLNYLITIFSISINN